MPVRGTDSVFNVRRGVSIVSAKHIAYRIIYELLSCIIVFNVVYQLLSEVAQFYWLFIVNYDVAAFDWPRFVIV